jgi:hypothetical protein
MQIHFKDIAYPDGRVDTWCLDLNYSRIPLTNEFIYHGEVLYEIIKVIWKSPYEITMYVSVV